MGRDLNELPPGLKSALEAEFELLAPLGRGATALTFQVRERSSGELRTLKVLRPDCPNPKVLAPRFEREAELLKRLVHPNVVHLVAAREVEGIPVLVLDYVEGGSLRVRLEEGGVSPQQSLHWAIDLADALVALHAQEIIHRDLKPANLLVADDAHLVLSDFGLAYTEEEDPITGTGEIVGAPLYMAPEQFEGQKASISMDIYSFGAVLFHMLEGRPPLEAAQIPEMVRGRISSPDQAPQARQSLGEDFETLILECLLWEPEDRPSSMEEIQARLEAIRQRSGGAKLPPASPPSKSPWRSPGVQRGLSLAALTFVPLTLLSLAYHLFAPTSVPRLPLILRYGRAQVEPGFLVPGGEGHIRVIRGETTIGFHPLSTDQKEPKEISLDPPGPLRIEWVQEGLPKMAADLADAQWILPEARIEANPKGLSVEFARPLEHPIEVVLVFLGKTSLAKPLAPGETTQNFRWGGVPSSYEVFARDPRDQTRLATLFE